MQWTPGQCQIAGNEHEDALNKRFAKISQTHITKPSYLSIKPHLKPVSQSAYRHKLETKLSQNPWKEEITKIPDWPRRKEDAEFRLCFGHDCLGAHLHRIGIRSDLYCMLSSIREPMDGNHLEQCTAMLNGAVCERYWEGRTKMMDN